MAEKRESRRYPFKETRAQLKQRLADIVGRLQERYPRIQVPLRHDDPVQLLVATILSAQCTDATVNKVTPELFARYPTTADLAGADQAELETLIHSTGFFRQKARSIQETCRALVTEYGGNVPQTLDQLVALPGVGRKTANVLLSSARLQDWPGWGSADDGLGIVVDTHVRRLARRLGLTRADDPVKVEADLMRLADENHWSTLPLRLIFFGREICRAQRPQCAGCPLADVCPAERFGGRTPWLRDRPPRRRG